MPVPERESEVTFNHSSLPKPATTWYKVFGDLNSGKTPLLILHGGPGACHEYLLPYTDLAEQYGTPMVFYDQIGNGRNTHYPEKKGDEAFWTTELFRAEIDNLVDHLELREGGFNILGQSWGGMLGAMYACTQPKGLRKLVIANSPANMETWVGAAAKLKAQLPQETQQVLDRCEKERDFENLEYEAAVESFYRHFLCRAEPYPAPELVACLEHLKKDGTTYETMNGPSEFSVIGSLRSWSIVPDLHKIEIPVLLLNGVYDEAQDECVAPYFHHIKHVKWVTFDNASHFSHVEQRGKTMQVVGPFLSW
jgi:proline-specific peptidase